MAKARQIMMVTISTPEEGESWRGEAASVSSENSQGPFDILWGHANFVTIVHNKPLILRRDGTVIKEITPKIAVIHASDQKINIYIGMMSK